MGVAGDDQIDAVHLPGQLVVLPLPLAVGAAVGQADDEIGLVPAGQLLLQSGHGAPGCVGDGLELHARHGGVAVRHLPHEAEDAVVDPAPLQDHIVPDAVAVPGFGKAAALRADAVGLDNGGQGIPAVHGGVEHVRQPLRAVVKLVVAQGGHVISHGAQGPQLRRLGGVDGLEQAAHGEVPAVQHQGVRVGLPLLLDQGCQAGVAAALPAVCVGHGEEVVVGVVGKQDGALVGGRGGGGRGYQRAGQQNQRQAQCGQAVPTRMRHGLPSFSPSLPYFREKRKPPGAKSVEMRKKEAGGHAAGLLGYLNQRSAMGT